MNAIWEHPWATVSFILAAGYAVGQALASPIKVWVNFRRPGDCPRCNGTGREPLK
jgi:hypothetical protein